MASKELPIRQKNRHLFSSGILKRKTKTIKKKERKKIKAQRNPSKSPIKAKSSQFSQRIQHRIKIHLIHPSICNTQFVPRQTIYFRKALKTKGKKEKYK
uniref:Uncharacterized protein n=1 Tax=Rhizophora mucronata TaxID=61149 RepID=A0A2P2N4U0_RHIMU